MVAVPMIKDHRIRHRIADAIRVALDELAVDHYDALTQEPPLTARAGQTLELQRHKLPKHYRMKILTQDLPDRGRGALEKKTGTDLYVGVEVTIHGQRESKGFFVQAKWDGKRAADDQARLVSQCRKMLSITDQAFVWSYGKSGVNVTRAHDEVYTAGAVSPRTLSDQFYEVFSCREGTKDLALPIHERPRVALGEMLQTLGKEAGLAFVVDDEGG